MIAHEVGKGSIRQVRSWGVAREEAVAILAAFRSENRDLEAVYLVDVLKKALEP